MNESHLNKIYHPHGVPPSIDQFAILCALLTFKIVNKNIYISVRVFSYKQKEEILGYFPKTKSQCGDCKTRLKALPCLEELVR